jgi:hypothetical protein
MRNATTTKETTKMKNEYGLLTMPALVKFDGTQNDNPELPRWSGKGNPPVIGQKVYIKFNGFGVATVLSYFIENGFLGVECECEVRPSWHIRQNGETKKHPKAYGAEIEVL